MVEHLCGVIMCFVRFSSFVGVLSNNKVCLVVFLTKNVVY